MKGIFYCGTVAGFKQYGQRELLRAALAGQTLAEDADRIQRRLDRAAMQDMAKQILKQAKKGGDIA